MPGEGAAAVDRALTIVSAIGEALRPLTLSETATATGLYKSTALRLLASLTRAGFVVRDDDGRYRLGSTIWRLASAYANTAALEDVVAPVLQRIVKETGESVGFFLRQGTSRICLICAESPNPLRHHLEIGVPRPLELGASGRVLKKFKHGAALADPKDIAKLPVVVLGDDFPDLASIAVPIFGLGGRTLGAISISGPLSRFDRPLICKTKLLLREIAIEMTERLGGDPNTFQWRGKIARSASHRQQSKKGKS